MIHEQIHQDDKKGDVYVNSSEPGLCKVHEIKGKQKTGEGRKGRTFGKSFPEEVYEGDHCDTEECTGNAPSEGIHAKEGNAAGDEQLA